MTHDNFSQAQKLKHAIIHIDRNLQRLQRILSRGWAVGDDEEIGYIIKDFVNDQAVPNAREEVRHLLEQIVRLLKVARMDAEKEFADL